MTEFAEYNASTHPIIKLEDDWNNLLDHGLVKAASYVVRVNGSTYEAINGDTGKIAFSGADASTVIQAALNGLTSGRTWKEHIVLKGLFSLSAKISIPSYTVLGLSSAKISLANSVNDHVFECDTKTEVEILGGEIDANGAGQGVGEYYGIHLLKSTNVLAKGVHLINAKKYGLVSEGTSIARCSNIVISDCHLSDNTDTQITFDYTDDSKIMNNFLSGGGYGIVIGGISGGTQIATRLIISGNAVKTSTQSGIYLYGGSSYISIIKNIIDSCVGYGIEVSEPDAGGTRVQINHIISENEVYNCGSGISVCWDYGYGDYNTVNGNIIDTTTDTSAGQGSGIMAYDQDHDVISYNIIRNVKEHGILLKSVASSIITGNQIFQASVKTNNTYDGICITWDTIIQSGYNIIQGNRISNLGQNHKYSINEVSLSSIQDMITDNFVGDAGVAEILITGAGTIAVRNKGYITEKNGTAIILSGTASIVVNLSGKIVNTVSSPTTVVISCNTSGYDNMNYCPSNFNSGSFTIYTQNNTSGPVTLSYQATYSP